MRVVGVAAVSVLLAIGLSGSAGPACAQSEAPHINLLADQPGKTQDELDAEAAREKAYKESLRKIPDAKASNDPWGTVRSDAPKAAAPKSPGSKLSASTKPKTDAKTEAKNAIKSRTGPNAN